MKKCLKCNENKSLECFYYDNQRNTYRSKCKECTKKKQSEYRINNKEKIQEYSKQYLEKNRDIIRMKFKEKYWKDKENKIPFVPMSEAERREAKRIYDKKYKSKHPEKVRARTSVIKLKVEQGFHKHHWSYLKENFKDVIILSNDLHLRLHGNLKYNPELKCYETKSGVLLDTREKHVSFINSLFNLNIL